jgi:dTDP-4-amino-4,6-dideoxygalactose transaminase
LIRLARSVVGDEEIGAVTEVIRRGYLAMGAEVQAFEQELQRFLGGGVEVMCVNTGTAALHLALQACGVGPGDEVLVPTLTYIATFQAISATGATPVACDVRPETCWLDVDDCARRVTSRTKAVIPVHYAGGVGDLERLYAFAREHNLRVIEDAAQAFGSSYRGRLVGSDGDIVCLSFDGIKNITSGEGGAVVTRDRSIAEEVQDTRLLGIHKDTQKRFAMQRSWEFDVTHQGWRYHMSDLFAAIGRVQLRRFQDEFRPRRSYMAAKYRTLFADTPAVRTLQWDYSEIVPFSFHVFVENGRRARVQEALQDRGIEYGVHYKPNHLLSKFRRDTTTLPVAERLHGEVLALPFHPALTDAEIELTADVVRSAVA